MAVDPELRKKFDAIVNRAMGDGPRLDQKQIQQKRARLLDMNKVLKNNRITRDVEYVH